MRKHRRPVIAAAAVAMALALGVIGTTVGMLQAGRAAEQERQAKVREAQRADGEQKAKLHEGEGGGAEPGLRQEGERDPRLGVRRAGPEEDRGVGPAASGLLRENLTAAVKELEGSAIGDPLEVAAMQNTLGRSLVELGEAALAVEVLQKALATFKAKLGPDDPDTLRCMNNLATATWPPAMLDLGCAALRRDAQADESKVRPRPSQHVHLHEQPGQELPGQRPAR